MNADPYLVEQGVFPWGVRCCGCGTVMEFGDRLCPIVDEDGDDVLVCIDCAAHHLREVVR